MLKTSSPHFAKPTHLHDFPHIHYGQSFIPLGLQLYFPAVKQKLPQTVNQLYRSRSPVCVPQLNVLFPAEGVPLIALKQHTAFVFISLAYSRLHTYRRSFAETSPRYPSVADSASSVKRLVFTCSPQTNLVSPAGNTSITPKPAKCPRSPARTNADK